MSSASARRKLQLGQYLERYGSQQSLPGVAVSEKALR
jgi:hypothetical protein